MKDITKRRFEILLGVMLMAVASPAPAQSNPAASNAFEDVRLTDGSNGFPVQATPNLAVDSQGRVFVAWQEFSSVNFSQAGQGPLGFARSVDGGRTWSRSLISRNPSANVQADPALTVDEFDRVYLARRDGDGCLVSRSDDAGATWSPPANAHGGIGYPVGAHVKSDENGTVHVAYSMAPDNSNPFNWKIQVVRSLDGGATWSTPKILATGLNLLNTVVATRPNGKVFVGWWEPGLDFRNAKLAGSSDRGETWRVPLRVNPVYGTAGGPAVVTNSNGSVFVAWGDLNLGDIVVARSDDDGATWSTSVRINDTAAGDRMGYVFAIDRRDVLHAAWHDTRTGGVNVYYTSSIDGGATWSANERVTSRETPLATFRGFGSYISLAADRNGAAYIAWTDWRDGALAPAIYFARTSGCAPPAPAAGNDGPIQTGQTLQLTASAVAGATYAWSGPNNFRSSLQNPAIHNVTAANSGTYSVTAAVDGCISVAATTTVTILPGPCVQGPSTLCLNASRFAVQVNWSVSSQGRSGLGSGVSLTGDTGYFWFFDVSNVELVIKILDGRTVNGRFWVFYGPLSDVEYTVSVTDTQTGATKTYFNPQGRLASVSDTSAF